MRDAEAAAPMRDDLPHVLATIGDEQVTMDDIRARIGDDLDKMDAVYRRQRSKAVQGALEDVLLDRVILAEADRRRKSVDDLIAEEAGGSLEPSEVEIAAWYEENRARTGGRTQEQLRPQIVDYLRDQHRQSAMQRLEERLREQRGVAVHFEPFRARFDDRRSPALGPDDAPVTLTEFSDFECPFCGGFFPTIKRLRDTYGDQLRIVYKQFPLTNLHPNAFKAAEASLCANEQGRFWEYHDKLFQEQQRLTVRDLKEKAGRLGLDQREFDQCLESGRYVEQVQDELREGAGVGVTGTPALFVNGMPVDGGAVAYEVVARIIDEELERKGR